MSYRRPNALRSISSCAVIFVGFTALCAGQGVSTPASAPAPSAPEQSAGVQAEIRALQSGLSQMESRLDSMQSETEKLREELRATRAQLAALTPPSKSAQANAAGTSAASSPAPSTPEAAPQALSSINNRLSNVEEQQQLLKTKVDDQYQTKVESASKYRVRLSGMALLNIFSNRGSVDNPDVPTVAEERPPLDSNSTFGATVRQSTVGIDVSGPTVAGARTAGELQADFFGGFPNSPNGVTAGIMRIRTATFEMNWSKTSLTAGQDALFFSPLSPTSLASIAEPAFSYSGNLWAWAPQVRLEHDFSLSATSKLIAQGGILDSLTGEPPYSSYYRTAQAGERSGQPGYAARLAWSASAFSRTATVGVGGYFAPENWGFGRKINGWAGTADWDLPLGRWFSLSGELYRGHAIGGLGAGAGRSVLYNGSLSSAGTSVLGLNSAGGWAQLKFRPVERLEFNTAFGEDQSFAADLRRFPQPQSYFNGSLGKNQSSFVNFIYHLRSNILFSLEYRRLWTSDIDEDRYRANQINLGIGVLF